MSLRKEKQNGWYIDLLIKFTVKYVDPEDDNGIESTTGLSIKSDGIYNCSDILQYGPFNDYEEMKIRVVNITESTDPKWKSQLEKRLSGDHFPKEDVVIEIKSIKPDYEYIILGSTQSSIERSWNVEK